MNLVGLEAEGFDGAHDQGGHQAGAVSLKESVQRSTQGIIPKRTGGPPSRVVILSPGLDAIESIGTKQDALDQQFQSVAIMGMSDMRCEQLLQAQAPQELVH
jgi:hypothetical protein